MDSSPLRLGLFGTGLDAYWPQFAGLKERLENYVARVAAKLDGTGFEAEDTGLADNPDHRGGVIPPLSAR
jgi:L-arabinose isomerase